MGKPVITATDIMASVPAEDLIQMGIYKMLKTGETRYDISKRVEIWAWELYKQLQEERRNGTI